MSFKFAKATNIKEGSYVVIDDHPCRVVSVSVSKPGKHGSSKVRIEAIGLIDNRRRSTVMPGQDDIPVPIIEKKDAQVLSVSGDTAQVMDMETYETLDLPIPEELQGKLQEGDIVLYWKVMGYTLLKQKKGRIE